MPSVQGVNHVPEHALAMSTVHTIPLKGGGDIFTPFSGMVNERLLAPTGQGGAGAAADLRFR